jgi:hypothetical protein
MRKVAAILAFMCSGCAAFIVPSALPRSVSLLNSDFEQLKQDEKSYWESNARAIDAFKAFQRKMEVFKASLTKTEQERFDQFWEKPSLDMAYTIPDDIIEVLQPIAEGKPPPAALAKSCFGKVKKAAELHNERAEFYKLAHFFDEWEKKLRDQRASLEQKQRDNIAHLETLAALEDIQQAQTLNTLLLLTLTPEARAPLPQPTFLTPPQRGVITGPGGTYYYRQY